MLRAYHIRTVMILNYLAMDTSDLLGAAGLLQNSLTNAANFSFAGDNKADAEDLMIKQHNLAMKSQWDAQSWQKYMWDLTNEYNLPANSVQRLKDAGLNPSLMYGSGDTAGQASGASSSPTSSPGGTPSIQRIPMQTVSPGLLTASSDIRLRDADSKLAEEKAFTERSQQSLNSFTSILQQALAGKAGAEADLAKVNKSIGDIQHLFLVDTFDDRKAITHESLNELRKSISYLDEQVISLQATNSVAYESAQWELKRLKADTAVAVAQAEYQRYYNKEMLPSQVELLRNTILLQTPGVMRIANFMDNIHSDDDYRDKVFGRWTVNDREAPGFERFNNYVGAIGDITGISTDIIGTALDVVSYGTSSALRKGFLQLNRDRFEFDKSAYGRSEIVEKFDQDGVIIGGSRRFRY